MTALIEIPEDEAKEARKERLFSRINKADKYFQMLGLSWLTPALKLAAGDNARMQGKEIWRLLGVPLVAIFLFLFAWAQLAPTVQTSLGAVPGPAQVWEQAGVLHADHIREREKAAAFYERQDARNAKLIANGNEDKVKQRVYTGKPTYYDQIWTSIQTVFFGFLIATIIAVPLGIMAGLSPTASAAMNPTDPDIQAGFSARMASYRYYGCVRRLCDQRRDVFKELSEFRHYGDTLLTLANADQYVAGRRQHRQGPR